MLAAAGITPMEEKVYRALLRSPSASPSSIARTVGHSTNEVRLVLSTLEDKGLVSRPTGRTKRVVPAPPDIAIEALLLQRQEELQRARLSIAGLVEAYRTSGQEPSARDLVEVVTGSQALRQRFEQLQRSAQREVLMFVKPPYATPSDQNDTELTLLTRGIRFRAIYDRDALDLPNGMQEIEQYIRAGEEARVVGSLPMKLAIADRTIALVPMLPHQSAIDPGGALLHPCGLLDALIALFETLWNDATPLELSPKGNVVGGQSSVLSDDDTRLLALLLSGLTDQAIANQLGLSLRTVQRRVQHLMGLARANNRMQLGWYASQKGWA